MKLWNTVKEVLEIAGYNIQELAQEFGLAQFHSKKKKIQDQKEKKVTTMQNLQVV